MMDKNLKMVIVGCLLSVSVQQMVKADHACVPRWLKENTVGTFRYLYNTYAIARVVVGYAVGNALANLLFGSIQYIQSRGRLSGERVIWALSILGLLKLLIHNAEWQPQDKWNHHSLGFTLGSICGFLQAEPIEITLSR